LVMTTLLNHFGGNFAADHIGSADRDVLAIADQQYLVEIDGGASSGLDFLDAESFTGLDTVLLAASFDNCVAHCLDSVRPACKVVKNPADRGNHRQQSIRSNQLLWLLKGGEFYAIARASTRLANETPVNKKLPGAIFGAASAATRRVAAKDGRPQKAR